MWGATKYVTVGELVPLFQSTHPCGVRHVGRVNATGGSVSIHAPVWGATVALITPIAICLVSIHAPVWGATCLIVA